MAFFYLGVALYKLQYYEDARKSFMNALHTMEATDKPSQLKTIDP